MCSRKLFNNDVSPNYLFVSLTTSPICHTHRATLARQASWRLLYNHIGQLKVNPQNPHKPADRVQCKHIIPYGQVKTIPPTIEKKKLFQENKRSVFFTNHAFACFSYTAWYFVYMMQMFPSTRKTFGFAISFGLL